MTVSGTDILSPAQTRVVSHWLLSFNRQARPKLRLFCFPYAGGDGNIFRDWAAATPTGVEVIGVQYPGRGANASRLIDRCGEMADALHAVVAPLLRCDFAFFGHSNGALISFELARRLTPEERRRHRHHFISARGAAHLPTGRKPISNLDSQGFIQQLRRIGGTPAAVLDDVSLMQMILPRLRADFALGENYAFRPGRMLSCDISTLHGADDHMVDGALVRRWAELAAGSAEHHVIDGDHFFLNTRRTEVLAIVRSKLLQLISQESIVS